MRNTTNEALMYDVTAALAASPDVRANDIRIHAKDGLIRLEGVVDNLAQKQLAEQIALCLPSVERVENDLVIGTDEVVTDQKLTKLVNDRLVAAGISDIGTVVAAGNAFLRGKTRSASLLARASEVAASVSGIRDVISEVEIAAGAPVDDVSLANDVVEAISENLDVIISGLHAVSNEGEVILYGEVEDDSQLDLALSTASSVPGVKQVECRMSIRRRGAARGMQGA